MRSFALACAFLLVMAAAPAPGHAFNSSFEVFLGSGSGDLTEPGVNADIKIGEFGLSYTYYFTDVATGNEPYGERVFLQHPSELSVGLATFAMEATYLSNKLEQGEGTFGIAGTYYFPNKRTGIGLAAEGTGRERELSVGGLIVGKEEESVGASRLFVHHYVTDAVRIGLSLNSENSETKETFPGNVVTDKYEQGMLEIYADALVDNQFKLGLSLAAGEREYTFPAPTVTTDVSEVGLQAGVYFSQATGLFLSLQSMKEKGTGVTAGYEATDSTTALTLDHYFTEHMHGALSLAGITHEETSGGTTTKVDVTAIELLVGFHF
jgi:hypothetical protein